MPPRNGSRYVADTGRTTCFKGEPPELPTPDAAMVDILMAIYLELRRLADLIAPAEVPPADDLPDDGVPDCGTSWPITRSPAAGGAPDGAPDGARGARGSAHDGRCGTRGRARVLPPRVPGLLRGSQRYRAVLSASISTPHSRESARSVTSGARGTASRRCPLYTSGPI